MGLSMDFVTWLLLVTVHVDARPSFQPYMGLKELNTPAHLSEDGRQASHSVSYEHPSGKHVKVNYVAELAEGLEVVFLDEDESVQSVSCDFFTGRIKIQFGSAMDAQEFTEQIHDEVKYVLTGGREWGCLTAAGKQTGIMRTVQHPIQLFGSTVVATTTHATYTDVFANLDAQMQVSAFPLTSEYQREVEKQEQFELIAASKAARNRRDRRLQQQNNDNAESEHDLSSSSTWGFLSWIVKAVKSVAHVIQSVVNLIKDAVKFVEKIAEIIKDTVELIGGHMDFEQHPKLLEIHWNYDETTQSAQKKEYDMGDHMKCNDCFFHFGITANLVIKIDGYQLNEFEASIEGNLSAHLQAVPHEQAKVEDKGERSVWPGRGLPTFTVPILGLPFTFHPELPTSLGWEIDVEDEISSEFTMKGSMKHGVKFADNKWGTIHEKTWDPKHMLQGTGLTTKLHVYAYVYPQLFLVIDHIGGPSVGLKIGLDATLTVGAKVGMCTDGKVGGISGQLDIAWNVLVGCKIQPEFGPYHPSKPAVEMEPKTIADGRIPLVSGCMDLSPTLHSSEYAHVVSPLHAISPPAPQPGTTFTGSLKKKPDQKCEHLPDVHSYLRLLTHLDSPDQKDVQFLQSSSGYWQPEALGDAGQTYSKVQCQAFDGSQCTFDANCGHKVCAPGNAALGASGNATVSQATPSPGPRCGSKGPTRTCGLPSGNEGTCRPITYGFDEPLQPDEKNAQHGLCCEDCATKWNVFRKGSKFDNKDPKCAHHETKYGQHARTTVQQCLNMARQDGADIAWYHVEGAQGEAITCMWWTEKAETIINDCPVVQWDEGATLWQLTKSCGDHYWCDDNCEQCQIGLPDDGHGVRTCPNMKPGTCKAVNQTERQFRRQPFAVSQHLATVKPDGSLKPRTQQCTPSDNDDPDSVCYVQYDEVGPNQTQTADDFPQSKVKILNNGIMVTPDDSDCYDPAIFPSVPGASMGDWILHGSCGPQCDGAVMPSRQPAQAGCVMIGGVHKTDMFDCAKIADRHLAESDCAGVLQKRNNYNAQDIADCELLVQQGRTMVANVMDTVIGFGNQVVEPYCRLWQCTGVSSGKLPDQDGDQAWLIAYNSKKPMPSVIV